jgi:hypothetical protein
MHHPGEGNVLSFDQQMDLVVHEHRDKDAAVRAVFVHREQLKVSLKVVDIRENTLRPITAGDHVVKCAGVFDARFSWHAETVSERGMCVNISIMKFDPSCLEWKRSAS